MPDLHSFVDSIHYENKRAYTKKQGNVAYLDGTPLTRPFDMPKGQRAIAAVFLAIGIIIGFLLINNLVISQLTASAASEQAVKDNLARQASIESLPQITSLVNLDNEAIVATLQDSGNQMFNATSPDVTDEMLVYRIPPDMTVEEAATLYAKGIGGLNMQEASKLLVGSWSLSVDRSSGTSMALHYADFSTGDANIAVQNAIYKEGFDSASITESDVDATGNTFSQGTLDADGTACIWRVSALPLSDMYSIPGLPESACYIGIRVTVA